MDLIMDDGTTKAAPGSKRLSASKVQCKNFHEQGL